MRIAIDITPLETGHKDRGVGMYTKLLVDALQKYEQNHSYHFFTRGQKVPRNIDLVHYPYFDLFSLTLPVVKVRPTVVTVHDLIPLVFPEHFPAGIRGMLTWQIQRLSLGQVTRIVTDSDSSKTDITRIAGISPDTIDVVHLAPSSEFCPVANKTFLKAIMTKYRLSNQFILYVGDINWNKNVLGLLDAFQQVTSHELRITLVLVGKAFMDQSSEAHAIQSKIDALGIRDNIVIPGFVPIEDLRAIYSLAMVYIQPSFYEGFGLPVLEAMACGCPVISSDSASLKEIAGPTTVIDPDNPSEIASQIKEALNMSEDKRLERIKKGILWVKRFTWESVARQTVEAYEKSLA